MPWHQQTFDLQTGDRQQLTDITRRVDEAVAEAGVQRGLCTVYCPHTTAAILINENADPDVPRDMLMELDKIVPLEDGYRHGEGNSAAHIKSAVVGPSETIAIADGRLQLGTWQGVFFAEFDGPRRRRVTVTCWGE